MVSSVGILSMSAMRWMSICGFTTIRTSQTFNDVARAVIGWHERGELEYIPFPDHLKGRYQSFTEAELTRLRECGYQAPFRDVAEGTKIYLDWLNGRAAL